MSLPFLYHTNVRSSCTEYFTKVADYALKTTFGLHYARAEPSNYGEIGCPSIS